MIQQKSAAQTWIFCAKGTDPKKRHELEAVGAVVKTVPKKAGGHLDIKAVLKLLGQAQVTSLLVEGGSRVHGSFLEAGMVDQLLLFVAPKFLGDQGVPLATFPSGKTRKGFPEFKIIKNRRYGEDVLIEGRFNTKI
jgi:diaminohydroxyphosphoribosylaminopyrimidine deaminase / 5-amino-6-(5-phosphoribosylamino)uracil reductase